MANSAMPSTGPFGANAASPSAVVEIDSPMRISPTSVTFDAAHDTASVPEQVGGDVEGAEEPGERVRSVEQIVARAREHDAPGEAAERLGDTR